MKRLARLLADTRGSVLLETVVVLPVLALFLVAIVELCLIANARQLTNYAAFCAGRTASVWGLDSAGRAKAHLATALAMTSISPRTVQNPVEVLSAFGLPNPALAAQAICAVPGVPADETVWLPRLAEAYIRTSRPVCDTGTRPSAARKHVVVNVTYIYRCAILPFGLFWGRSGLDAYIAQVRGLPSPIPGRIEPVVAQMENRWRWNVPLRGRAVMDYWGQR